MAHAPAEMRRLCRLDGIVRRTAPRRRPMARARSFWRGGSSVHRMVMRRSDPLDANSHANHDLGVAFRRKRYKYLHPSHASGNVEVRLLLGAVVARVDVVVIGEDSQSLRDILCVRDAHPHRTAILTGVVEIEVSTLGVGHD
jgi:hypothetical protein